MSPKLATRFPRPSSSSRRVRGTAKAFPKFATLRDSLRGGLPGREICLAGGAELVLRMAAAANPQLATVLAESAYRRDTLDAYMMAAGAQYRLVIVSELPGQKVFVPQPKRWLVKRYFAWLRASRLLAREYEGRAMISRSNVYLRSVMLTINTHLPQLAKRTAVSAT